MMHVSKVYLFIVEGLFKRLFCDRYIYSIVMYGYVPL